MSKRCRDLHLFPDSNIDADITGLANTDIFTKPHCLISRIDSLHKELNSGIDVQRQIDQCCLPLYFHHKQGLPDTDNSWKIFMPRLCDVFGIEHVHDLGNHIRALSAHNFVSTNVFSRLIQYSLPYVKHNRLTFPKYEDVNSLMLMHMVQYITACCLGLHQANCKKPLWQLRYRIIMYVYTLLSFGSCKDLYEFCCQNLNLLRISLIEYFIVHVQENMPCEYESMQYLFGTKTNIAYVFSQFKQNINAFRGLHMQSPSLQWNVLNAKAHCIIEKCNRICKGKPRLGIKAFGSFMSSVDNDLLRSALKHEFWSDRHKSAKLEILCSKLRQNICFSLLPKNIVQLQIRALEYAMKRDSVSHANSFNLHVCVKCCENKQLRSKNLLRTNSDRQAYCNHCCSADHIICVNTLGRIVQCYDNKYYYCPFCLQVHTWHGTSTEFSNCIFKAEVVNRSSHRMCAVCERQHNLHPFDVLDSNLGVQQHLHLCGKHQPYSHQLAYIHDLDSLITAVSVKCTRSRYI